MIYIDGYNIEQYPNDNYIKITLPPTYRTAQNTLSLPRKRREKLTCEELLAILFVVLERLEGREDGEEDERTN